MSSVWHKLAALVGASGVAFAAYGAHGLKTDDPHYTEVWKRANQQQMWASRALAVATPPHVVLVVDASSLDARTSPATPSAPCRICPCDA